MKNKKSLIFKMNMITMILSFLVFYLVIMRKPSFDTGDTNQTKVNKSLDNLKLKSRNWLSSTMDTLRALYDSLISMATTASTAVKPKTSGFVAGGGCGCG